jgi:hypothetical protein
MKNKKLTYKKIKKSEIEEGILDDTFSIKDDKTKPDSSLEISTHSTSDEIAKRTGNLSQRWPTNTPFPAVIFEDSLVNDTFNNNGLVNDETNFDLIDDEEIVDILEMLITTIKSRKQNTKIIYNVFSSLIKNLPIENLPQKIRNILSNKLKSKNNKVI